MGLSLSSLVFCYLITHLIGLVEWSFFHLI